MDPFSLAVGITGLVALTAQTSKLTRQYIKGVKHASKSASALSEALQLLHNVLCNLDDFLRSDEARRRSFNNTSVLVSSTSVCRVKMEALHAKLMSVELSRIHQALWPLNEKDHERTVQELRAISATIQFAMAIDQR